MGPSVHFRYLLLSPARELREAFLAGFFGKAEVSPLGERTIFPFPGGQLEVVGTSLSLSLAKKLADRGVRMDAVLVLLRDGDAAGLEEARRVSSWAAGEHKIPCRVAAVDDPAAFDRETVRKVILDLLGDQEKSLPGWAP